MTVFSSRHLTPPSTESSKPSDRAASRQPPGEKFRKLMQVSPVDKESRERDLFALIEEENAREEDEVPGLANLPVALPLQAGIQAPAALQGEIRLGEIQALFEKMASAMIVQNASGEAQTTLFLDNPNSIFNGTQITITEFSTAPKIFNIEIASNPLALSKIQEHQAAMLAVFQEGRFNFGVHRIDTHIREDGERPVFHFEESTQNDKEPKGGLTE